MKRMFCVASLVVVILMISLPVYANGIGTARLSLIQGDVVVLTQDTGNEWVAAAINLPLLPGDRVWVPQDGRAEIQFLGRTYLRADENTDISITNIIWDRYSHIIQTALTEGRTYVSFRSVAGMNSVCQVDTPLLSVLAYENAQYDILVRDDGFTEVVVLGGAVSIDSPYGVTRVVRGSTIAMDPAGYAEIYPSKPRSQWIRWNQSRDSRLVQYRTSARYLPPELDVYSTDFDEYGRWIYVHDYGYVWNPTVVSSGWAPYRHGRWVWSRGDYVWVSYEPWGWAPYHYGRWAFKIGIGWFWVPPALNAVFWSPGYVAWIYTPTHVSWVPLAPREVYYGYGDYGPYSVNLTKVNVRNVNVTNVYVNSRVTNAVTVVHHDTFLTGKQVKVTGKPSNLFVPGARVSPGRPDIKPVKATVMPLPEKVVHQKSLPSQRVIEKQRKTDVKARPLAVKKDISVFRREGKVIPLPVRKLDKPKPAAKIEKQGKSVFPDSRSVIEVQPQTGPKEPVRRSIYQPEVKGRPSDQQQLKDKPVIVPQEGAGRMEIPRKEEIKRSVAKPMTKEKSVVLPKGQGGRAPAQVQSPGQSFKPKDVKDIPSVAPKREIKNSPPKHRDEHDLQSK